MKVNKLVSMQRGRGGKKGGKGGNSERCGTGSRAALDRVEMILNMVQVHYWPATAPLHVLPARSRAEAWPLVILVTTWALPSHFELRPERRLTALCYEH